MALLITVSRFIEEVGVDEKVIVRLIRYVVTLPKAVESVAKVVGMTMAVLQFDTESRYATIAIGSLQPIDAPPSILLIPGEGMVILSYERDHVIFEVLVRTRFEIFRYRSGGTLEYDSSNTSNPFGTLTHMTYELWSPRWAKREIMIEAMRISDFANVYKPSQPFARPRLYPIKLQQLTLPAFLI
jgi:hypothetical protein